MTKRLSTHISTFATHDYHGMQIDFGLFSLFRIGLAEIYNYIDQRGSAIRIRPWDFRVANPKKGTQPIGRRRREERFLLSVSAPSTIAESKTVATK